MPRVAALLDVMQISDVSKIVSADTFERPVYAGNAIQTVKSKDAKGAADAAAKLDGVKKVLLADAAAYEHALAEPVAALIVSLAGAYDSIVAPATSTGKNVMPRVAALLDVMQVSEVIKVVASDTFERPVYAGNAIQVVKSKDTKKVLTVRT